MTKCRHFRFYKVQNKVIWMVILLFILLSTEYFYSKTILKILLKLSKIYYVINRFLNYAILKYFMID